MSHTVIGRTTSILILTFFVKSSLKYALLTFKKQIKQKTGKGSRELPTFMTFTSL